MDEKRTKKQIWLLVALVVVIAGLIIAIVAIKMNDDFAKTEDEDTSDIEITEDDKKKFSEVAKIVDLARIPSFLTSFGQEKVDLAESAKGRFLFIEQAVLEGSNNVSYDFVADGYLLRYEKLADFRKKYEQTFGEWFDFEADLAKNKDEFYDCAEKYGEDYYCFKNYFAGEDLIFEELGTSNIEGEKGNYVLTGKVNTLVKLEAAEKQYKIEFENYFLKNLTVE